jgi:hypothetical protein
MPHSLRRESAAKAESTAMVQSTAKAEFTAEHAEDCGGLQR